jgi:hypothetical protein
MKNYLKDVAKLLGVEIGEEFVVKSDAACLHGRYAVLVINETSVKITESTFSCVRPGSYLDACSILGELLRGAYYIERKPWKPKYKDTYWSIGTGGVLEPGTWLNDFVDISLYRLGNCYRTAEEASANADKWISFCESDETIKC